MDKTRRRISEDGTASFQIQVTINGQDVNADSTQASSNEGHEDNSPVQCLQCGDTIEGLSKICPSCGYIPNKDSMKDSLKELQRLMSELRIVKKTWGKEYEVLLTAVGYQIIAVRSYYGEDPEVKEALKKYADEKEVLIKKGKAHMVRSGITSSSIFIIIILAAIVLWRLLSEK